MKGPEIHFPITIESADASTKKKKAEQNNIIAEASEIEGQKEGQIEGEKEDEREDDIIGAKEEDLDLPAQLVDI